VTGKFWAAPSLRDASLEVSACGFEKKNSLRDYLPLPDADSKSIRFALNVDINV
jgi:hypothetical protein